MRLTLNKKFNKPSECLQNYSQIYGFSEQHVDVAIYSSVISSIAFSNCTKFFNNFLISLSLIITKSRAKLKVILSENYCISSMPIHFIIPFVKLVQNMPTYIKQVVN